MAYCNIYFDDAERICDHEFKQTLITLPSVAPFCNTLEYHKQNFYDKMIKIFSQFEEQCYIPTSINEIEVFHRNDFVLEYENEKFYLSHIDGCSGSTQKPQTLTYKEQNEFKFVELYYGTSGGLHLGFKCLLYKFC
jgi:hypothetical protein